MKKLVIETTEVTEKFVDVEVEGEKEGVIVTARFIATTDATGKAGELMLEIESLAPIEDEEGGFVAQRVTFPADRWSDVRRMGDAAIETYIAKYGAS